MNFLQVLYKINFELNTTQPSCGTILIFLLLRLQWNRINTEAGEVKETSKGNSSITKNHQSPVQLNSQRLVVHMTTTVSPSTTSHAPPAVANIKENVVKRTEIISGAKSRSLRPSDGTTFSSNVSKNWNNSATNIHRMSCAKLEQQVTFLKWSKVLQLHLLPQWHRVIPQSPISPLGL